MGHFAREYMAPRSQDRGKREIYKQGSKEEKQDPKAPMAIDRVEWDWSYMANEEENHALVADEEAQTEFALMAKSSSSFKNEVFDNSFCSKSCLLQVEARLIEFKTQEIKFCEKIKGLEFDVKNKNTQIEIVTNELEQIKKEKEGLDRKLTGFEYASKDLNTLLGSQRSDKNKEDDTITDYSRPSPSVESNSSDLQNNHSAISEHGESSESIMSKPMIKFIKSADSPTVIKTNKGETVRKPSIKCAEMYRNTHKSPKSNSQNIIDDKGYWDSGCSRHMTGNISYLSDYEPYDRGYLSFGQGGGKITGKGKGLKESSAMLGTLSKMIAERRNRTLIEAARTMLADAKLPVTFWTEAVNTACYVQNRVLVNKSQNKTSYELFNIGCHVMIVNTLDHLGKFDAKGDEGYFIRYSIFSKTFRVFNKRTKRVEENLHVYFLENKLIEKGAGPNWLFDIDTLTNSMNYVPVVVAGTSFTNFSGTKDAASQDVNKDVSSLRYIAFPNWFHEAHLECSISNAQDACNADAPESSRNSNPTATLTNPRLIKWSH
nr:hypothetical protein [Tanacetum cinerariifolium]